MGVISVTVETAFPYPAEVIYDFVSNPANWRRTFPGSAGVKDDEPLELPLKVGATWTEEAPLKENTYLLPYTLITAVPPRKWAFQQVDNLGCKADGTPGVDGISTISYSFESVGNGLTLFKRNWTCELPKDVVLPAEFLDGLSRPENVDRYHAAIGRELDKEQEVLKFKQSARVW